MIIKRYPNRKLYNTAASQYITLDEIAELLRGGKEVSVVDSATGEDMTAQVLSQVIAGQEKRRGGYIPGPVLAGLVQAGDATLDVMRRAMLLPLDLFRHVDEEIQRRIEALVKQGDLTQAEGMLWLERLLTLSPRKATDLAIEREIRRIMADQGVPTHDEFQHLVEQVDALADKLDELD
jgi:polyhydroxyalkanoate synthesis repressor PhaR